MQSCDKANHLALEGVAGLGSDSTQCVDHFGKGRDIAYAFEWVRGRYFEIFILSGPIQNVTRQTALSLAQQQDYLLIVADVKSPSAPLIAGSTTTQTSTSPLSA